MCGVQEETDKIWEHQTSYYQLYLAFYLSEASEFPVKKITGMVSPG